MKSDHGKLVTTDPVPVRFHRHGPTKLQRGVFVRGDLLRDEVPAQTPSPAAAPGFGSGSELGRGATRS